MLKILYKRDSHLEIVNRSIKNCKHSCLFEQLFYRSSHWVSLEFQKTRPTGRDLFGTRDLELGIHNSKINRQESALWLKKRRGTQNRKKIQISDFLLFFSSIITRGHYKKLHNITKARKNRTTNYINHWRWKCAQWPKELRSSSWSMPRLQLTGVDIYIKLP